MRFIWKIFCVVVFTGAPFVMPAILGCQPPAINYPIFNYDFLTPDQAKKLKVKSIHAVELRNGDTINKINIRYNKTGELSYYSYLKYRQFLIENVITYDSISKTYITRQYSEKELIEESKNQELDNSWFLLSTTYPFDPSFNDFAYRTWDTLRNPSKNEELYYTSIYVPKDSIYKDTVSLCTSKRTYNPLNLSDTIEYYNDWDTTLAIYTYNENKQLKSEWYSNTVTTYSYTKNILTSKSYYIDSKLKSKQIIQRDPHIETTYSYNDTSAITSKQIIIYNKTGLIEKALNFGYTHRYNTFIKDSSYYDIINNDTLYGLIENEDIRLDYTLPPETILFTYEFYD